jgi:UDP-N-acetylmuramate dehydrogenase
MEQAGVDAHLKPLLSLAKGGKLAAGLLIDRAGLKGQKIGGALVSEKHANFIVNTGNATAADVLKLISLIKTRVRDMFGVNLVEEVQIIR